MTVLESDATAGLESAGPWPAEPTDLRDAGPVVLCLLGQFRMFAAGKWVIVKPGSKSEILLSKLAVRLRPGLHRDRLMCSLWPDREPILAAQSLNTLVYSLHRLVGDALGGVAPIVNESGLYRLNLAAGIEVDVAHFESLLARGERHDSDGRRSAAFELFGAAIRCYGGDLALVNDVESLVERERLRGRYLGMVAHMSDWCYEAADYRGGLRYALLLLGNDPCREDAHRLAMRCHVRLGERAQALRQYQLCEAILRSEFDTTPEAPTTALFNRIRLDPETI